MTSRTARGSRSASSPLGWILPPLLLAATGLGAWLVTAGPPRMFGWVVGACAVLAVVWVLVSALFPGQPERTCPACERDTLVPASRESTAGVLCKACGFSDGEASSFLMAEEEGPLEPMVLARRRRRDDVEVRIHSWSAARSGDAPADEPAPRAAKVRR